MAYETSIRRISIGDGTGGDPLLIVNADVTDTASHTVVATQVFLFSVAGMSDMDDEAKTALVAGAVDGWAASIADNLAAVAPLLGLVGAVRP